MLSANLVYKTPNHRRSSPLEQATDRKTFIAVAVAGATITGVVVQGMVLNIEE